MTVEEIVKLHQSGFSKVADEVVGLIGDEDTLDMDDLKPFLEKLSYHARQALKAKSVFHEASYVLDLSPEISDEWEAAIGCAPARAVSVSAEEAVRKMRGG